MRHGASLNLWNIAVNNRKGTPLKTGVPFLFIVLLMFLSCNLEVEFFAKLFNQGVLFDQYCILFALVARVAFYHDLVDDNSHFQCCSAKEWAYAFTDSPFFLCKEVCCHLVIDRYYKTVFSFGFW